ncbi:MAG: aminotransferase class III-fold pyridoxal phosphate-dependent enzyme [OCS116 cluster bacterium]|nr:aminotransferase class III-fold pyridoxal phosphate-dependent enzyme [OCS116 cluster bacterium]
MQVKNIEKWVLENWHMEATLTPLVGEFDLNFRVKIASGDYILKIMAADCTAEFMQMQIDILNHLRNKIDFIPHIIPTQNAQDYVKIDDRFLWMISAFDGKLYADCLAKPLSLVAQIGTKLAQLDIAMQGFHSPALSRSIKWDLSNASWIAESIQSLEPNKQARVTNIIEGYYQTNQILESLPKQAIHNDLNDYNILVLNNKNGQQDVSGYIDFGDLITAPKICNIAICAAYLMLDVDNPLAYLSQFVSAYHAHNPLSETEIKLIWRLALMRLAVSVTNSAMMKLEKPDDAYVSISENAAWRMIDEAQKYDDQFVSAKLLHACGFKINDNAERLGQWMIKNKFHPLFDMDLSEAPIFDFSVIGKDAPSNAKKPDMVEFQQIIDSAAKHGQPSLGCYAEPRIIYAGEAFFSGATQHQARDRRSVHIAIDIFLPAGTPLKAPYPATVHSASIQDTAFDYGGLVTLKHITDTGQTFYTLYGHLAWAEVKALKVGQVIKAGEAFAKLGDYDENGTWPPHVHFQLGLTDWHGADWPGVVSPDDLDVWKTIYPDPAPLLNLAPGHATSSIRDRNTELTRRKAWSGANLSLTYDQPLLLQRGYQCQMYDEWGRTYLDAFNNVPHVGHAHPRLAKVAARQMQMLNTNTRYLHQAQSDYAEAMLAKMPAHIDTLFFVNSASEATELAMRMAREYSGAKNTIVCEAGYHGNTLTAIELSEYKFNGKGGKGAQDWVHVVPIPDGYRGEFKNDDPDAGAKYAKYTRAIIDELAAKGEKLAAFITESFPSVGGQIIPPQGYLKAVFEMTRQAGGIAIADEVQTGLGRLGDYFWGFEQQDAVPDMILLGKPIGNGHPIGILATTRQIADRFANGMEFFSTFGGSTLSCTIGLEVLKIIEEEKLQDNAKTIGTHILNALQKMQNHCPSIGDVRGLGLFIGVEMIAPDGSPCQARADYIANQMAQKRILIGTDGPHHNILKLRAPLVFSQQDADFLLLHIEKIFKQVENLDW